MSDITEVAPLAPDASIDDLRKALAQLIENQRVRERDTAGEKSAKFITWGDAEAVGLVIRVGGGSVGTGGGVYTPPDDPLLDLSPPEATTSLQAFSSVAYIMVTVDAPTYPQGGGNGYTEIYAANYDGTGPLPIFDDAVLVGTMTGRSPVLVIDAEPGVETHFWAGAVTSAGVKQVDTIGPTGGTNGVTATPGLIDSQHIVKLTASKITAGSIAVGEDITSTGFVSGSAGWRIRGNGAAEFSNVVARGSIYASFGSIGGALIGSTYVQSSNYNGTSLGWKLDNTTGKIYAFGVEVSGQITATSGVIGGWTIGADYLRLGATGYGTGTGLWMGLDGATPKVYYGSPTSFMKWDGTDLVLTKPLMDSFTASIAGGDIVVDENEYDNSALATRTVTPSGGRGPYTYLWIWSPTGIHIDPITGINGMLLITAGISSATVTLGGGGLTTAPFYGRLICIVTDSNGRNTVTSVAATVTFANSPSGGGGDIGGGE